MNFFNKIQQDNRARAGIINTKRGKIRTPVFMPVATAAAIKPCTMDTMHELDFDIILSNTYHMIAKTGVNLVNAAGGIQKFMNWNKPVLTDSGGFQSMSLGKNCHIDKEGIKFKSHVDGRIIYLTPETTIDAQLALKADIIMQLDHCIQLPSTYNKTRDAMLLSLEWSKRSKKRIHEVEQEENARLFGIVQGGCDHNLRIQSIEELAEQNFPGYSIGGLATGENKKQTYEITEFTCDHLPFEKPRYLMGVGTPEDLLNCTLSGVDMFDCVHPTRAGRHGHIYTSYGKINIRNAKFKKNFEAIDPNSKWKHANQYSLAYLHHLFKSKEPLAGMLGASINLSYYKQLMTELRQAIINNNSIEFANKTKEGWSKGYTDNT